MPSGMEWIEMKWNIWCEYQFTLSTHPIHSAHLGDNEASHDCTSNQIQTVFLLTKPNQSNPFSHSLASFSCIVLRELDLLFTFALILCDNKSARLNKMVCQKEVLSRERSVKKHKIKVGQRVKKNEKSEVREGHSERKQNQTNQMYFNALTL